VLICLKSGDVVGSGNLTAVETRSGHPTVPPKIYIALYQPDLYSPPRFLGNTSVISTLSSLSVTYVPITLRELGGHLGVIPHPDSRRFDRSRAHGAQHGPHAATHDSAWRAFAAARQDQQVCAGCS
jgi:hypothetical protein